MDRLEKGTKGQRDKERKKQRDQGTMGQWYNGTMVNPPPHFCVCFLQSGGATQLRVCSQRGLPRLVFLFVSLFGSIKANR